MSVLLEEELQKECEQDFLKQAFWDWLDEKVIWENDLLLVNNVYITKKLLLQNISTDVELKVTMYDQDVWSIKEVDTGRTLRIELL